MKTFANRNKSPILPLIEPYQIMSADQMFLFGWQRGSVVRTSVFDWRTFPDLRLIYG